jgi:drug/metabolite transporter (DMT)-like permease
MNKETRGIIITGLSAIAFGLYPSTAKLAYMEGANSVFVIIVTTLIRALFLVTICLFQKKTFQIKDKNARAILLAGFFQAGSIFGIIASLVYLPAAVTITLVFTHTTMLFLLLAYKKEADLNAITLFTTVAALFGVSLVVDLWNTQSEVSIFGLFLASLAAVATTIRLYMFGRQLEKGDPAVVGAHIFTAAFLFTLLFMFYQWPVAPISSIGYLWVIVSGLALAVPTYGMFVGISLIGSFRFSLILKMEPIFTALFAVLIVGEILKPVQYFGMALVIVSLVAYQVYSKKIRAV